MNKDFEQFSYDLGERESSNDYKCVNDFGFAGRWQFGKPRLYDLGISLNGWTPKGRQKLHVVSKSDFLNDPDLQDQIFIMHVNGLRNHIARHHADKIGVEFNGQVLTISGLVAGSHLIGSGGIDEYLETGLVKADGLGTKVTEYIGKFAGYNLYEMISIAECR